MVSLTFITLLSQISSSQPYSPLFWWFEVVDVTRRLVMTGVLSTIQPGSYTQLSVGLIFSFSHTLIVGILKPYGEISDNMLCILSGCQVILFYLTAYFLRAEAAALEPYDR